MDRVIPKRFVALLQKHAHNVRSITCSASHDEDVLGDEFTLVLKYLMNVELINFNYCKAVYDFRFLESTKNLTCLRLSRVPYVNEVYLAEGLKSLQNLKQFEMTNVSLVCANDIIKALSNKPTLQVVNIVKTGNVRPEAALQFLQTVPNLEAFYFSSYYSQDTPDDKISWYKMLRQKFPHIKYSNTFITKVEEYEREDANVVLLKYLHMGR